MRKRITSIILSAVITCSISIPVFAEEVNTGKELDKGQAIKKLENLSEEELKLSEKDGQVFLSGKLSHEKIPGENAAIKFLEENKAVFGIDSVKDELKLLEVKKDDIGHTSVKFVQVIDGTEVEGSLMNVHFDENGVIASVNGNLEENKDVKSLGKNTISEEEAIEIAKKQFEYKDLENTPKAEKVIITKDDVNYEAYKVNIYYMEPTIGSYDVFVEATSGQVIKTEDKIRFNTQVKGSGIDVLGKTRELNLNQIDSKYEMKDLTNTATGSITTYDQNNTTSRPDLVSNWTGNFNTERDKASVSAHYNASKVIDFYKELFNRNSLDNNGLPIESYTHHKVNYNNAFWDGYRMIYGDGDGEEFTYLSGDLDVVGHEMTHGVIDYTAKLEYHNQSGALNESMADVFGVLISTYNKYNVVNGGTWTFDSDDWVIGDDIYTPNIEGDALRSLSDPTLYDQPEHMNDYEYYPDTKDGDWGGVHINSGIPNKAAYIIASNLGMEKTAKIYYRALNNYMTPDTNFEQCRNFLVQAAEDLYGKNSNEAKVINNGFSSVGVLSQVIVDSLIGSDRYDTAAKLSQSQFNTANTIMITNGGGALADGLAATPLATYKNAPLLLTEVNTLPEVTKSEIKRLSAKNAIIVGGTTVVNDSVIQQLKALGITSVERIGGADRYDTSLEIAKYIDKNCYDVNNVVISNGLGQADSLSIASVAGRDKMAIILVEKDKVPTNVYNWLQSESLENAYIIGGTTVISDNVLNTANEITSANITNNRLGGRDRYATNAMIIEKFYGDVINKTYITRGLQLVDALSAGPVAAINGSPVVLAGDDLTTEQTSVLSKKYGDIIVRTGGGISDKAVDSLKNCLQQ